MMISQCYIEDWRVT